MKSKKRKDLRTGRGVSKSAFRSINWRYLATFCGYPKLEHQFALAKVFDETGYDFIPAIPIVKTDKYLDLTTAQVRQCTPEVYLVETTVFWTNDVLTFCVDKRKCAVISAKNLIKLYGENIFIR